VHPAGLAAESSAHWKPAPDSPVNPKLALVEAVRPEGPESIDGAAGGDLSIVYEAPFTGTPESPLPAWSAIAPALVSRSCSVPDPDGVPVPVPAATVYVAPLPVTPVTAGDPDSPLAATEKFDPLAATPVTGSLNVTVQETLAALVGLGPARVIEDTVGACRSIVHP
jgi:hypothetical protein